MIPEIVFDWFDIIESKNGITCVPQGILSFEDIVEEICPEDNDPYHPFTIEYAKELGLYQSKQGWFGRLTMPGYLDSTDWSGPFKTEEETKEYLDETYGEDNEDS
jgi:hypothetical protein